MQKVVVVIQEAMGRRHMSKAKSMSPNAVQQPIKTCAGVNA